MVREGSGSQCYGQALAVSTKGQSTFLVALSCVGAYIAADRHVEDGLGVGPDHSIRSKVLSHARWLPGEDNGAVLGWCCEVRPCDWRCVAHYLGSLDEVLDRLLRSQLR